MTATPGKAGREQFDGEAARAWLVGYQDGLAEQGAVVDQARRDAAALAEIRTIHRPGKYRWWERFGPPEQRTSREVCVHDRLMWPCPTARAAAVAEQAASREWHDYSQRLLQKRAELNQELAAGRLTFDQAERLLGEWNDENKPEPTDGP